MDEVQKTKQQLEDNIASLEKQKVDLTNDFNNKLLAIESQIADFENKLKEVLKYKKVGQ